jgi:hypothetical protein
MFTVKDIMTAHIVTVNMDDIGVHPVSNESIGDIFGLGCRNRLIWAASQSNR